MAEKLKVGTDGDVSEPGQSLGPDTVKQVFDRMDQKADDLKKDFMTIFGIFASLVTFLAIEVQVFKDIKRFSLLIGTSSFLISAILMFAYALFTVVKGDNTWKMLLRPFFGLVLLFLLIAIASFAWAALVQPGTFLIR